MNADFSELVAEFYAAGVEFPVAVLSRHHLIQNKRSAGRLQDLADVERLEADET